MWESIVSKFTSLYGSVCANVLVQCMCAGGEGALTCGSEALQGQ